MSDYLANLGLGTGIAVSIGMFAISFFIARMYFKEDRTLTWIGFAVWFVGLGIFVLLFTFGAYYQL